MPALTGAYLFNQTSELGGWFATGLISQGNQADIYFNKALIELVDDLYLQIQNQSIKDELYGLVTSDFSIPIINPTTNAVYLSPITALNVTFVGTLITVTTLLPHNLFTGQSIVIQGTIFTTNSPNGTFVVTRLTDTTFTYIAGATPTGTYTKNSGTFYVINPVTNEPLQLIDYYHLLNATVTYVKPIYPPISIPTLITGATNTPTIRITLFTYNKIRSGDQLTLAGFSLNTNANGAFYIDKVNDTQFDLYLDSSFQTPVAGNGAFVASDSMTVSVTYIKAAKPYMPDEKISSLSKPTEDSPRYLESDIMLNFYPQSPAVLKSVVFDYLRLPMDVYRTNPSSLARPPYNYISTADDVLDLSTFYHPRFLMRLPEAVHNLMARMTRDNDLLQENAAMQQNNP